MKLNSKKIAVLAGLATCLVLPWTAQAGWSLIDDFESYAPGSYIFGQDPGLVYHTNQNGGLGEMDIVTGIDGIGGENAAWFWYGETLAYAADVWHQIPLPTPIEVNAQATLYYRVLMTDYDINYHVMLSKVAVGDELDNTALWGSQAVILRDNGADPLQWDARDGSAYINSNPTFLPDLNTWYEVWIQVDNSFVDGVQAGIGGYSVYVKGPSDAEPMLLTFGGDTIKSKLDFRNQAETSIKTLVLIQDNGDSPNVWLIDDIWEYDSGLTTAEPGGTNWCGWDIAAGDNVDTGSWMEWVYVGLCPNGAPGWVYSYNLNSWIYVAGCPSSGGSWVYVPN
jgi:hypothetical protein